MRLGLVASLVALALLWTGKTIEAQSIPIGNVTRLTGRASVMRSDRSAMLPLKLNDDVFLRDRITTGEASLLQLLLGGKAVLTMREHTSVTSSEAAGASTIDITAGRIKLAVHTARMNPSDRIYVVTPNAIAAVRGTMLVVEVWREVSCDADPYGLVSRFTVLAGTVGIAARDAATANAGPLVSLGKLDTITISRCALPAAPSQLAETAAEALDRSFGVHP